MSKQKVADETGELDYTPRERGLKRRDKFLDVASRVFLERGFEAASLQQIVAEAGGSLATLYRLFGDKEGLFYAVIERKSRAVYGKLELPELAGREPVDVLSTIGRQLLDLILSKDAIGVHRLLIAEGGHNPRLREIFMELAPDRVKHALAEYFDAQTRRGMLAVRDSQLAATQFLEMIKGDFYMRGLLGESLKVSIKERDRVVANAVTIFLDGIRKR